MIAIKYRALSAPLLLACSIGCQPSVNLTISNPSLVPVAVQVENTDEQGQPQRSTSIVVPAATQRFDKDGKPIVGANGLPVIIASSKEVKWKNIDKLSKIKLTYGPQGSNARANHEPPLIVHNSSAEFKQELSLSEFHFFDAKASQETILAIANNMSASGAPLADRLIDVEPLLGSVVVATFTNTPKGHEHVEVHGCINIKAIKVEHSNAIEVRGSTYTKRDIVSSAAVTVPVYGNIASSMSSNHVFDLAWSIKHYPFLNGQFNLGVALQQASLADLESIKGILDTHANATIAVVQRMHVIESASFGITEGRAFQANFNAAIASVFTANAAYEFRLSDQRLVTLPSMVVDIKYQRQRDRAASLEVLKRLIDAKKPSPTPPPPRAKPTDDLIRDLSETLTPVDVGEPLDVNKKILESVQKDMSNDRRTP